MADNKIHSVGSGSEIKRRRSSVLTEYAGRSMSTLHLRCLATSVSEDRRPVARFGVIYGRRVRVISQTDKSRQ